MRDQSHAGQLDFNTNFVQSSCFLVAYRGVVSMRVSWQVPTH